MKYYITVGLIIIISFFTCLYSPYVDYEKIADQITKEVAIKLKKEKQLFLEGTGGSMMNDIQMMMMAFHYYKPANINIARQLITESVEEYLNAINSNTKIRPFLHNYPFKAENLEIVIFFYNLDGSKVSKEEMNIVDISKNKIVYYKDYPEKNTIKSIYEESYENAIKVINQNKL